MLLDNWLLFLIVLGLLRISRLNHLLLLRNALLLVLDLLLVGVLGLLLVSSVAFDGKHMFNRHHDLLQPDRLDVILLRMLLFNVSKESGLRLKSSLATNTFEQWLCVICAIVVFVIS